MATVEYRTATRFDADQVAALHADSWRRHYRGVYSDAYLDGDVLADRRAFWTERLSQPAASQFTIVAERAGRLVGFAHTRLDEDPTWGAQLESLHVSHELTRQGVGTRLMSETARTLLERRPTSSLYLWVLEENTAAQAFYAARGGVCVGREVRGPFPGGGWAPELRYAWVNPSVLL